MKSTSFFPSPVLVVLLFTLTRSNVHGDHDPNLFCEAEPAELPSCTEHVSIPDATTTTTVSPSTLSTESVDTCPSCLHICEEDRSRCDLSEPRLISKSVYEFPLAVQPETISRTTENTTKSKTDGHEDARWKPRIFFDVFKPPLIPSTHRPNANRRGPDSQSGEQQHLSRSHDRYEQQPYRSPEHGYDQQNFPEFDVEFEQERVSIHNKGHPVQQQSLGDISDTLEKHDSSGIHERLKQEQFPAIDDEFEKQHKLADQNELENQRFPRVNDEVEKQEHLTPSSEPEKLQERTIQDHLGEFEKPQDLPPGSEHEELHEKMIPDHLGEFEKQQHLPPGLETQEFHGRMIQDNLGRVEDISNAQEHHHRLPEMLHEQQNEEAEEPDESTPHRRIHEQNEQRRSHVAQEQEAERLRKIEEEVEEEQMKLIQERQKAERIAWIHPNHAERSRNLEHQQHHETGGSRIVLTPEHQPSNFQLLQDRLRHQHQQRGHHDQQRGYHGQQRGYLHEQQGYNDQDRGSHDQHRGIPNQRQHLNEHHGQTRRINPRLPLPYRDNSFRRRKRPNFYYKFME